MESRYTAPDDTTGLVPWVLAMAAAGVMVGTYVVRHLWATDASALFAIAAGSGAAFGTFWLLRVTGLVLQGRLV